MSDVLARPRPHLALLVGALLFGCSDPVDPTRCAHDRGCVDWENDRCGSTDRCLGGICARPPATSGEPSSETGEVAFEVAGGEVVYAVEVADDPFETARGLSCRPEMARGWGMVLSMGGSGVHHFTMRDARIPLDVVFVDEARVVVGVVAGAQPGTIAPQGVAAPSRYLVELHAGEAARAGILSGAGVRMRLPEPIP